MASLILYQCINAYRDVPDTTEILYNVHSVQILDLFNFSLYYSNTLFYKKLNYTVCYPLQYQFSSFTHPLALGSQ